MEYSWSQTSFYGVSACYYGSAAKSEYDRPENLRHDLPWCNLPCPTGLPSAKATHLEEKHWQSLPGKINSRGIYSHLP